MYELVLVEGRGFDESAFLNEIIGGLKLFCLSDSLGDAGLVECDIFEDLAEFRGSTGGKACSELDAAWNLRTSPNPSL